MFKNSGKCTDFFEKKGETPPSPIILPQTVAFLRQTAPVRRMSITRSGPLLLFGILPLPGNWHKCCCCCKR
jgi:hypothetical protein